MPTVSWPLQIDGPVSLLKRLKSGLLAIVDAKGSLSFVDLASNRRVKALMTDIALDGCGDVTLVDIDKSGHFLVIADQAAKQLFIYDVKRRRRLQQSQHHHGRLRCVVIDPRSHLVATGGEDGHIFIRTLRDGRMSRSLAAHRDFVSAIAFSEGSDMVATASLDRSIHLTPLRGGKAYEDLLAHSRQIIDLCFVGETRLLSAAKEGELILWDVKQGTLRRRLERLRDEITSICVIAQKELLFVGTSRGDIALFDLQHERLLSRSHWKLESAVCALSYEASDQILAAGSKVGQIRLFEPFSQERRLQEALDDGEYDQFYAALAQDPIWSASTLAEQVEMRWGEVSHEARHALFEGKTSKAKALLRPFGQSKVQEIKRLFHEQEAYALLKRHIIEKRYALAYAVLGEHPDFRSTEASQELERVWERAFKQAQIRLRRHQDEEGAKALFAPFRGISQKSAMIRGLFEEHRRLMLFDDLQARQEWRRLFELVHNHPGLRSEHRYAVLLEYGDRLFQQAMRHRLSGELYEARKLLKVLLDFPDLKVEAKGVLDAIE